MLRPVNGSVPLEAGVALDVDVVAVVVPAVVPALAVELDGDVELVEGGGAADVCVVAVLVVLLRGSTYCWSPAEVLVPDASALAVTSSPRAASATEQLRIWRRRRTLRY
jgi:hypothetical protein